MEDTEINWTKCPNAERIPGKVSGQWLVVGTRIPVQAVLDNADDFTPEQMAEEIYDGLPVDRARRIIQFASVKQKGIDSTLVLPAAISDNAV